MRFNALVWELQYNSVEKEVFISGYSKKTEVCTTKLAKNSVNYVSNLNIDF
jgi:hypothetical protein